MTDYETEIHDLIHRWADAVARSDLAGAVADRATDIMMFDVPPPEEGVRGLDAYRDTWPPLFRWLGPDGKFEIVSLSVTAGDDVAHAWALLRCGNPEEIAKHPDQLLRLTIGLRRDAGSWIVTHEHHSFTDKT
jgi:ketosteroid isomerase-like protein